MTIVNREFLYKFDIISETRFSELWKVTDSDGNKWLQVWWKCDNEYKQISQVAA